MLYTSAEANKLLRSLNDELSTIIRKEDKVAVFNAASNEDAESLRPEYNYRKTQDDILALNAKIRIIKHALNVFNSTTELTDITLTAPDGTEYHPTIDEALILLPQLSGLRGKYNRMQQRVEKERVSDFRSIGGGIIDYRIINYPLEETEADFKKISDLIAKIQLALDTMNNTVKFEIDV